MLLSAAAGYAIASSLISSGDKQAPKAALPSSRPPHQAAGGSVARAWLGADTSDLPGVGGVVVVDVVPGSPADSAGLEPGDVITQIDGRPIRTSADVQAVLAGMKAGEAVEIQYQRGPISATAQATLTARPPNVP
jgi:S1-C subfamily serine protease